MLVLSVPFAFVTVRVNKLSHCAQFNLLCLVGLLRVDLTTRWEWLSNGLRGFICFCFEQELLWCSSDTNVAFFISFQVRHFSFKV